MTAPRQSHCDKVLAALREGPKTASYLYSLGLIAHSRVAELRQRGHLITCERVPGREGVASYLYRLNESEQVAA